jgi:DNA-binding LacI/PurR family transcriptional regulator
MKQKITMKFIADKAGVSTATVSSVINKTQYVSEELTKRVNKTIAKYNYQKDLIASSLRKKSTKMIGIIVMDIANPQLAITCREIEKCARQQGYSVVICNTERDPNLETEYIDILKSRSIDGMMIVSLSEDSKNYRKINEYKIPTVFQNRQIENINADFIFFDVYKVMIEAMDYLVSLGHKRIAFINREYNLFNSKLRFKGYLEGLRKNNLKFDNNFVSNEGGFTMEDGYKEIKKFFKFESKPTALIAFNDILAIGAIKAIKEMKLKIPDDFSVIGSDNIEVGNYLDEKLTSITLDSEKFAINAFKLLMDRINGDKSAPKKIYFDRTLVIKDTTGIYKGK